MKHNHIKNTAILFSAGLMLFVSMEPLNVSAAGMNVTEMLGTAGVASILDVSMTEEEYIAMAEASIGAAYGYTNIGITNIESGNLNVRKTPATSGKIVGKMRVNAACEVLDVTDGWAHIKSGEVDGYVSEEFLTTGPAARVKAQELVQILAIAQTDGLNVRKEPNTESEIVTQIPKGEGLEVLEEMGEWVKVAVDSDEAYVSAQYVKVEEELETAITMTELLYGEGVSDVRVDLSEYAKQFVGNPYVWGGTSLTKGADCSGFVLSVYKKYGFKLPHHSVAQARMGTKISTSELKPADLIFYGNSSGTINHVAIYIGGGKVVHASNAKTGIKISKYNYRTPVKCVRLIND